MTLQAPVLEPGTAIPMALIRIEAELSPKPRYYWRRLDNHSWNEADSIQEATARALGHRDLADVEDDNPCEGHESLRGDLMGASFYCDGSCER